MKTLTNKDRKTRTLIAVFGGIIAVLGIAMSGLVAQAQSYRYETVANSGALDAQDLDEVQVFAPNFDVVVTTAPTSEITYKYEWHWGPSQLSWRSPTTQGNKVIFDFGKDRWKAWGYQFGDQKAGWIHLTVPEGTDVSVDFGRGLTTTDGNFGHLDVDSGIGTVEINGAAEKLTVNSGVGEIKGSVDVSGDVRLDMGIGNVKLDLGSQVAPQSIALKMGVGAIELLLPATTQGYSVQQSAGIGHFGNATPPPSPEGVPADTPVAISVSSGIGSVDLRESDR